VGCRAQPSHAAGLPASVGVNILRLRVLPLLPLPMPPPHSRQTTNLSPPLQEGKHPYV